MASFKSFRIQSSSYMMMVFLKRFTVTFKINRVAGFHALPQFGVIKKGFRRFFLRTFWGVWGRTEVQLRGITPVKGEDVNQQYVWAATVRNESDWNKAVAAEVLGVLSAKEIRGWLKNAREKEKRIKMKGQTRQSIRRKK